MKISTLTHITPNLMLSGTYFDIMMEMPRLYGLPS